MKTLLRACGVALALGACASAASAQQAPVVARGQILLSGVGLVVSTDHQTVPRNIATSVVATLVTSGGADPLQGIPAGASIQAELRGPAFGTPVTIAAPAGRPLDIPPLAIVGTYVVEHIRLVSDGVTLLEAAPDTVTIDVIDKVIVSQVTTRALSASEIAQKGIFVDQTNFDVVNFTAAFGITGQQKTIDFPMILPKHPSASLPASPAIPGLPALAPAAVLPPPQALPQLQEVFHTNNISVSGLTLKVDDEEVASQFSIPPIPGVIIIPGNIAYLHQFFSVMLMVSNVAPGGSNLVVRDVTATIVLPAGADTVAGTDDDPLRMARVGNPPVAQSSSQPVVQAGPDGAFGTPDDIPTIAPSESGDSEFLVEGRKEGTQTVQMQISATLDGLPIGPVKISGFATGIVEVRNPTFSLTLSHPATVTAGEAYDLLVTVTNTSDSPANQVSVNLSPNSISGAVLDSNQSVTLDSIAAHDAATATFRLTSQVTGNVTATSFTSDDSPASFVLRTAVGALGIPLSPNSLVLPPAADNLPNDLRMAGVGLLGQAFALATSPAVPAGLAPITQQVVYDRATAFAQAGQRVGMHDSLVRAVEDLTLDMLGNGYTRLSEHFDPTTLPQAQTDYRGFDTLFRQSARAETLLGSIAAVLGGDVQSEGILALQKAWAQSDASGAPFLTIATGSGSGGAPVVLRLIGPGGGDVGQTSAGGPIARNLPYADFLAPLSAAGSSAQLILDAVPASGAYTVQVSATAAGSFDLGLTIPGGPDVRHVTFAGVSVTPGSRGTLTFDPAAATPLALSFDDDGDGIADRTVAATGDEALVDAGPTLVSAVQVVTALPDASQFGQVVGLLFSEELLPPSSEDTGATNVANYSVDGNQVVGAALQPGGRIVLLSLRDGVGPLVARSAAVTGVTDRLGTALAPAMQSMPITMTIGGNGASLAGVVRAANGTPVTHARLQLSQTAPVAVATGELAGLGDLSAEKEVAVSVRDLGTTGAYSFDFVRQFGLANETVHLQAVDLDTGETADVQTQSGRPGQHLDVDIVFVGTGTLAGRTLAPDGVTPLAGAVVKVSSLTKIGQVFGAVTDASGAFTIAGIPAGNFTVQAAHLATNSQVVLAGTIPTAGSTVVQNLILVPLAQSTIQTGSVKGQVFHASDNTAAAGVAVYTDRGGLASTDASGSYEIDNLPAGVIHVTAIDQANLQQGFVTTTVVGNSTVIANLLVVGGTGTISGVVVGPTGLPVANALIGGGIALVHTDAAGAFTLQNVPVGSRQISALDETTQSTASASVTLLNAGDTVNVRLAFTGTGSIAGRVFQADGVTPFAQMTVFLLGGTNASTVTDSNGGYRFDHLALGAYKVSAFLSDFSDGNIVDSKVDFAGEVQTTNVVARGKGRVTGTVFAADGQTPLISHVGFTELQVKTGVLAPAENPQCLPPIEVGDQTIELPKCQTVAIGFESVFTRTVDTDTAGSFAFDGVFTGPFTVEAANGFSPAIIRAAGAIAHPGDTVNVVLKLQATSSITGTVFEPDGVTHAGSGVVVTFNSGTLSNVNVVTDASGVYSYPLVNPGGFSVTASEAATGLVGRTDGTVDAGATAHANIRLLGKGTVKVTVSGANGLIAGATVTVARGTFPNDSVHGATGADGSITFAGGDTVTEGPFSVSAFDPSTGITGYASGSVSTGGAETDVQVRIDNAAGSVHGRFLMPDGATPIPNAQVQITSVRGQAFATTDSAGAFALVGVFGGFTADAFDPVTARRGRVTGTIATDQQDVLADIIAAAEGTVTGVVRFSNDSRPAPAVDVTLIVNSMFGGQLVTSTGVDGGFTFPGVSAGSVTVQARDPVTGLSGSAATSIENEGDTGSVQIVLQVPQLGVVQGTVLKADGTPAIGAQVTLSSGAQTTVDDSGGYSISDVPVGPVTVTARAPIGLDGGVSTGTLAFNGDVATIGVHFIGTGTVTATVDAADGTASAFASVSLSGRDALGRQISEPTAQTNAQGTIQFTGIPVGSVGISAVDPSTGLAGSASGALANDGSTLNLTVTLQPAAGIRARVLHEDKTTPGAGLAVELNGQAQRFGSTAADGSLAFSNLALGQYDLVVSDPLGTGIVKATVSLTQQGQTLDLGTLFLHETAPSVQQIVPLNGGAGVGVTQPIRVTFSTAVDPATVTTGNLRVSSPSGPIAGAWTLSTDGLTATFVPAPAYRDFTSVSVRVTTGVTDVVGRALAAEAISTFTTADSVPPVLVSRSPASAARDVAPTATIRIGYSEAIDPARFSGSAITLSSNGAPVPGRVDFALSNTVAIFTPDAPLVPNAVYTVAILPAADVFGNLQAQGSTYTFSTLDTIAPSVDALTAADGTTVRVNQSASITATVSAPDVASVDLLVNGIVVQTLRAAPFTFAVPVTTSLTPGFTAAARATDLSGNVGPLTTLVLTVAADQPPTVSILSPADGLTVDSGAHVTVSVQAADDVGVANIGFQSVGAAVATSVVSVDPPKTTASATFQVDVPPDALGGSTITLKAAAIDTAGQSSPTTAITLTVRDTTPPAVAISAPAPGTLVDAGQTVSITVNASDPSGVASVALAGSGAASFNESRSISPAQPQTQQTFSVAIPQSARPTDQVTLSATAVDAAGNAASPVLVLLTVRDAVAPAVTLAIDGGLTTVQPGRTVGFTVSASDAGGVAKLGFDATGAVAATGSSTVSPAQSSSSARFTLSVPLDAPAGGTVTLTANATDASGNVGHSAAAALPIVSDAPPTVHLTSPVAGGSVTEGQPITISADASDDVGVARVEFRINGTSVASISAPPYSTQQLAPAGADGSPIVIVAVATDSAGQTSTDQVTLTLHTDSTPPHVVSIVPADGAAGVSITTPVTVIFSEPLDAASVTSSSFSVAAAGQTVTGVLALSDDHTTIHFTPSQPMPLATAVTVALTSAITDRFGNALTDANGSALTAPLTFTFTTGAFAITSPAAGADVIEHTHLVLQATAAPSLAIATVVFTVNAADIAATGGPTFAAGFDVPASTTTPTLTIVATARDQAGAQVAQDTVTVHVTVGLQMVPSIVGIPVGGVSTARLALSSALTNDLAVTLHAVDSAVVGVPSEPVVIRAGAVGVDVPLAGLAVGNTSVLATSTQGVGSTIASVSVPVSGQTLTPMAVPVGIAARPAPAAAELIATPASQVTLGVRVAAAPAASDMTVSASSSDDSIARVIDSSIVAAGQQVSTITFATGDPGVAAVTVRAGNEVHTVLVIVGTPSASQLATLAPAVGAAIEPSPSAGQTLNVPGTGETTTVLRLLSAPAAADTVFTVSSSNPNVATVKGPLVVHAGQQTAAITIDFLSEGTATLFFSAGDQTIQLAVGAGASAATPPPTLAPPAGIAVRPAPIAAAILAAPASQQTVLVRLLAAPASSDTPVAGFSTDPSVATIVSAGPVTAGSQVAAITIQTGVAGTAGIELIVAGQAREIRIISGSAESVPAALAVPVGVAVEPAPLTGVVIAPSGATAVVGVRLLAQPASTDVVATITNGNPGVAMVSQSIVIPAGQQVVQLGITPVADGIADLTIHVPGQTVRLTFISGTPPPGVVPIVTAPIVGVTIRQ